MADVFISYKREDRAWAERLDSSLTGSGLSTWWDKSIQAGSQFADAINTQVNQACAMVVIWSESSVGSQWVRAEAGDGFGRGILIPVRIDNVALPIPFSSIQTLDLRSPSSIRELVKAAHAVKGSQPSGVVVNGGWCAWPFKQGSATIAEVLRWAGYADAIAVAVELNQVIVPKSKYMSQAVRNGDELSIVEFVRS